VGDEAETRRQKIIETACGDLLPSNLLSQAFLPNCLGIFDNLSAEFDMTDVVAGFSAKKFAYRGKHS
jgi:hypothetical protein